MIKIFLVTVLLFVLISIALGTGEQSGTSTSQCGCHTITSTRTQRGTKLCVLYTFTTADTGRTCKDISHFSIDFAACPPKNSRNIIRDAPTIEVSTDCNGGVDTGDPPCGLSKEYLKVDTSCDSKGNTLTYEICTTGYEYASNVPITIKAGTQCSEGCTVADGFCKPSGTVVGDPHVKGFRGQGFDFDGDEKKYYNFLTAPNFQFNVYLDRVASPHGKHIFVEKVGIKTPEYTIELATKTFGGYVKVNDKVLEYNTRLNLAEDVYIEKLPAENKTVTWENVGAIQNRKFKHKLDYEVFLSTKDYGFNFFVLPTMIDFDSLSYAIGVDEKVHGVVGQTLWNVPEGNKKFHFIGEIKDYEVSGLFADDFKFNLYTAGN